MSDTSPTGFYGRLARWVIHNRGITTGLLGLLTAISAYFMLQISIDGDVLKLMPLDDPSTQALARLDAEEGGINVLTLAFQSEDLPKRDAFMEELYQKVVALPEVDYVLYKLDPNVALKLGILQVPKDDLVMLRDRLQAALSMGPALANPFIAGRLFDFGPLTDKLASAGGGFVIGDKDIARLLIRPKGSAHDIPFSRQLMAKINAVLDELDPEARGIHLLWKGGAYKHNVEDYEGIAKDITWTTATSFVLVLIIITAAFRAPRALGLIFIPLILSNIWTAGLAGATVGSLNTFTSFVNAVLIGLGVEFGVHLYARFREERASGLSSEEATIRAWDLVGGACTSAALTSAAGFAALLAAHFAGFQQLGWLLSLGLILTLIAEIVCMPLLITVMEPRAAHFHTVKHHARRRRRLPMLYRLAPLALIFMICVTLVSALMIKKVGFEFDLSELRRAGMAYEDLTEQERKLARDSYAPMIIQYEDAATMEADYLRISEKIAAGRWPEVARVISVLSVLPPDQAERVALVQEIVAATKDPNAIYFPAKVKENLKKLEDANISVMQPSDLPLPLQHVLGAKDGHHRLLMVPAGNMWDIREAAKLVDMMKKEFPDRVVAGEYITLGTLYKLMSRDAPVIASIAALLVCFFTWTDLRTFKSTLGAILVQIAGLCWWGALLALSDIKLSIVNFVGIPIVMGIGIDVMIHMIHRLNQEGPGKITKVLSTTGWASALGTSTTMVAFAALSLGSSQGIRSLGLLVLLGELAVTVAGFALIPLGFASAWHIAKKKIRDTGEHELAESEEH